MDPSYHIRGRENSINVEKYLVESSQVYKLLLCVILCKLSNLKFKLGSLLDTEHRYLSERNMEPVLVKQYQQYQNFSRKCI